ncbi:hypothetical protein V8G54_036208 [Vigna mungo]|uniref:Biogenesis of lysosome-related organelles complex 1 subunit 1 n=1 Tax=Vigna mungo TaxID=3915 RepID=A0AAQ3MGR1_VIGMU
MNGKGSVGMEGEPKGLEASLHHLLELHHHKSLALTQRTEKAKKDAIRKTERVSDLLVEAVNGGVHESFINQKRIELEIRALAATITRFMKQTDQWLATTHVLNTALKIDGTIFEFLFWHFLTYERIERFGSTSMEIGDFENWMKIMEYDCKNITTAIQNIHQE